MSYLTMHNYKLLTYKGDVDLEKKLKGWEEFDNLSRGYLSLQEKMPYEVMRVKLNY